MPEDTPAQDSALLEPKHPARRGKEKPPFKSFLPFIHLNDENTKGRFIVVLRELFEETGEIWRPGGCYGTEHIERVVRQIKGKLGTIDIIAKNYLGGAHYFLTGRFPDIDQEFIIDPFGVPTPGKDYVKQPETIIPFFGEVELSPAYHKKVYTEAKPIAETGYRRFHP